MATLLAGLVAGTITAAAFCLYDNDHVGWPFFFQALPFFLVGATTCVATIGSALHLLLRGMGVRSVGGYGLAGASGGLGLCAWFSGSMAGAAAFLVVLVVSVGAIAGIVYQLVVTRSRDLAENAS